MRMKFERVTSQNRLAGPRLAVYDLRASLKMPGTPATAPATSLHLLRPGSRAIVRHVGGETTVRQRLLEMGFVSGARLRVVQLAPLGDPMQVELHGAYISLRRSEARTILVETD